MIAACRQNRHNLKAYWLLQGAFQMVAAHFWVVVGENTIAGAQHVGHRTAKHS